MGMSARGFLTLLTVTVFVLWRTAVSGAETIELDGLIEPCEVVDIGSPSEGVVARVAVDRGSSVEKGEVLVALESSVERAALNKARALAAFEGDIAQLQTELAFARRVHERVRRLAAVSTHDKDQAATDIVLTGYRLDKARENKTLARLELSKAQAVLALRSIKSPISGVVVDRYVSVGEYVDNKPLMRVAQVDPLRVEVIVPARLFGRIVPGMEAIIVPELEEYGEYTATVSIVDRVLDSASNTFGVRLKMPNSEKYVPAGLKCQVRFEIDEKAAAWPPRTASVQIGN